MFLIIDTDHYTLLVVIFWQAPCQNYFDFEESSPRNYFLEILVPRGLFLFLEGPKPRDINTRFSSSFFSPRYHPRGINHSRGNFARRESIILSEMTVNCWKIIYLIVKKVYTIKILKKILIVEFWLWDALGQHPFF